MKKITILAFLPALLIVGAFTAATTSFAQPSAEVGSAAPDFTLTDLDGDEHTLSDYTAEGKVVVLEWFNPDCPFVVKHYKASTMADLAAEFGEDVVWLAINSNAPGKQGSGAERNRRAVEEWGISYPVCLDEPGEVGQRYRARTTPHMYVIDAEGVLRYAGAIDDSPRGTAETNYVRAALEAVLAGEAVETTTTRPYGCSVKYVRSN